MKKADFNKDSNGLLPAIIQDVQTHKVLMLGYMNEEALKTTQSTGKVTFYSRSKQRLWTKGEESGNFLNFNSFKVDCDLDALLVFADPTGPTCHTGADTCWEEENASEFSFIGELENVIAKRKSDPQKDSYISSLFDMGLDKIAQKVGEEAVETVIEAVAEREDLFMEEAADLFFHYLILLKSKGRSLKDIGAVLNKRKG